MAAFSNQHQQQPFLLDPAHHTLLFPQQADQEIINASSFLFHYHDPPESPSATESTSSLGSVTEPRACYSKAVEISEPQGASLERKRRNDTTDGSCEGTACDDHQSNEKKSRKQKKHSSSSTAAGGQKKAEGKERAEAPEGYIHVRARRGQATDSHSLAERVRREKISERMKLLQALVPGCDKVTGKALMLDEIINYVQSLQNQVEFLSMKLASLNPTLYGFGMDFDEQMNQQEKVEGISQDSQLLPLTTQSSPLQHRACDDATRLSYPMVDSTSSPFLLHGQGGGGPIAFSQYNGNLIMQVGEQGQGFLDQALLNSRCSFQ